MSALEYVTIDEVKRHLNIVPTDYTHDDYLRSLIYAASAMVKNHLGNKSVYIADRGEDDDVELDSNFEPILESFGDAPTVEQVRNEVKVAVLLLIGELFLNREGAGNFERGYLPAPVAAILYPLRDPQVK